MFTKPHLSENMSVNVSMSTTLWTFRVLQICFLSVIHSLELLDNQISLASRASSLCKGRSIRNQSGYNWSDENKSLWLQPIFKANRCSTIQPRHLAIVPLKHQTMFKMFSRHRLSYLKPILSNWTQNQEEPIDFPVVPSISKRARAIRCLALPLKARLPENRTTWRLHSWIKWYVLLKIWWCVAFRCFKSKES